MIYIANIDLTGSLAHITIKDDVDENYEVNVYMSADDFLQVARIQMGD